MTCKLYVYTDLRFLNKIFAALRDFYIRRFQLFYIFRPYLQIWTKEAIYAIKLSNRKIEISSWIEIINVHKYSWNELLEHKRYLITLSYSYV